MVSDATSPRDGKLHVLVIGGGLAGLAAAVEILTLDPKVHVTLVERNAHLGGKMNLLRENTPRGEFRFDMGPTIITLPQVLRGIVRRSGRSVEDYIRFVNLDPQWRCFYEDGTVLNLRLSLDDMARELEAKLPGTDAGEGYRSFVAYSRRMMRLSEKVFYYRDLGGVADMMKKPPSDPALLSDVMAMRMHSTVAATIEKHVKEPHVRQMCEHFLQYVGSSPFLAPAILSLIAAAQVDHGCWYAMAPDAKDGGTRCVARTLERIIREEAHRTTIITGTGVKSLALDGDRVRGVVLEDGRELACDAIISNCDVQRTYRDLSASSPRALREQRRISSDYTPACSGVVFYLGLDRQYDHVAHHNFLFSKESHEEFEDIYARGIPARDPTLYLAVPSRSDPTQAPPGCEALYILIHTPYMRPGQRWEGPGGLLEQYRPTVMAKMERMGWKNLEKHIVVERHLTPQSIDRMYNAEGGAIYGLASHGKLKGGFKPRNRSTVFKNLYLAGGSANPGPGVPMVLMSGVTAARSLAEDFSGPLPRIELGMGIESAGAAAGSA